VALLAAYGPVPAVAAALRRVDDGAIIDQLDAAWKVIHPRSPALVAFAVDDDGMLMWLTDRGADALAFAKQFLLTQVYTGKATDALVRAANGDTHAPDLIGIAQHGVVYTGGVAKIAEHGGAAADDRDVPLVVSGAGVPHDAMVGAPVQTTQIAPTILRLLGLDPTSLQAVRTDHTQVLPAPDQSDH
jgi:arylsulfatase A-like enzyme